MHRRTLIAILALAALPLAAKDSSGQSAFDYTKKAVAFGPRSGGSPALTKTRAWIKQELTPRGCQLIPDTFTAQSPDGPVPMENIICKFPGKSGRAIAIT